MPATPGSSTLRRLTGVALDALLVLLAVGGVLVLLAGSRWGLVALALGLVGLTAQLTAGWRRPAARRSGLGRAPVTRVLVVAGVAVAFVPDPGSTQGASAWGAGLAAALLVAGIVAEPFVARAAAFRVPVAAHLPGVPEQPRYPDLRPHTLLASLLACAVGLVLAAAGGPGWAWLLVGVLALVPLAVLAAAGVAKILLARRLRRQVPRAVARYAPDIVLYTGRPDDASYQLTMWLPYLQRSGLRFLIMTRNAVPAAALAGLTDIPVVEVRAAGDLDRFVVPSLKGALYVNASSANGALVRFQHLTHIYIGHGDSDKPPSYNPTHALYDEIYVAGPAATRRYAAHGVSIAPEKFRVVGRPQVEDVRPVERPIGEVAQPVVLYAPTWRGHVEETNLYSLPDGERIVQALLDRGATVVFRPHPFSYDFAEDAAVIRPRPGPARGRPPAHRPGAPVGGGRRARARHPGLPERGRRHGLRREQRRLGLPQVGQALRHGGRALRARSPSSRSTRSPRPPTWSAVTWPTSSPSWTGCSGPIRCASVGSPCARTTSATSRRSSTPRPSSAPCSRWSASRCPTSTSTTRTPRGTRRPGSRAPARRTTGRCPPTRRSPGRRATRRTPSRARRGGRRAGAHVSHSTRHQGRGRRTGPRPVPPDAAPGRVAGGRDRARAGRAGRRAAGRRPPGCRRCWACCPWWRCCCPSAATSCAAAARAVCSPRGRPRVPCSSSRSPCSRRSAESCPGPWPPACWCSP